MARFLLLPAVAVLLLLPGPADADILVGKKNGDLVECKVTQIIQKKIPGQGGPKDYFVAKMEDGSTKQYLANDYFLIKRKPSWEVRAEEKEWYKGKTPAIKETWHAQESFAKQCRMKKYLDEEALAHFRKAYELRKPEIKDDIEGHTKMARILENTYALYEEAKDEWRWVYGKKKEPVSDARGHTGLASWCMKEGLYEEALDEYNAALALEPNLTSAKTGLEKLRKALEVPVNAQMLRVVKGPLAAAMKFLKAKQNQDGSFGSDFAEAGVHGHHGMTALVGLSWIAKWEFDTLDNLDLAKEPPQELAKLLGFVLTNRQTGTGLRGPDVWGPIFRLEFLAKCYKKEAFRGKQNDIKQRVVETLEEMKRSVRSDGGWAYYDFVNTGITFVTASAIVAMMDCREAGLPFDEGMIGKACQSVLSCKQGAGTYTYRPGAPEAAVGCCGRSSLCEYALMLAGQNQNGLTIAVTNFFNNRHLLEAIKGDQGTHIGEGKTAPYYYLFGHYWTTRAIKHLPRDAKTVQLKKMADVFLKDQEQSGAFWDTPLTKDKEVYGTALGALTLYELALELRK